MKANQDVAGGSNVYGRNAGSIGLVLFCIVYCLASAVMDNNRLGLAVDAARLVPG